MSAARKPFDHQGRFVPLACPQCGNGTLRHQGAGKWTCDGLADPDQPDQDLVACPVTHYDGEPAPRAAGAVA